MSADQDVTVEETGRRWLTADEIRDIKVRLSRGETQREVAAAFGVSRSTIATHAPESDAVPPLGFGHMPDWMDRGLCAQTDPESFFPEKGGETRTAKAICAVCPVMAECLDYALDNDERFGIWGGLSERDRRKVKAAIALEAGTDLQCPDCTASFTSEAGMRVHRRSHDRPASADLPCPHCDQICKGQTGLSVHLNHHFLEDAS